MTWIRILQNNQQWSEPTWINFNRELIEDGRELLRSCFKSKYPTGKPENFDSLLFTINILNKNGIAFSGVDGYLMRRACYESVMIHSGKLNMEPDKSSTGWQTLYNIFEKSNENHITFANLIRPKNSNTVDILKTRKHKKKKRRK